MILLRRLFRLVNLALHVLAGVLITTILAVLQRRFTDPSYQRLKRWWLNRIVGILGGQVTTYGEPAPVGSLLVSNHVSWLDIPLLGGQTEITFLSKSEVQDWPILGWLAAKSGTLFIERGKRDGAKGASEQIATRLEQQERVLIFPESTTTDNINILPFHARLFAAAVTVHAPIQPVAIHYLNSQGQTHALVPYLTPQTLMQNLWAILAEPKILIEVHFLPSMDSQSVPRKALATYSEQQVRTALKASTYGLKPSNPPPVAAR